MGSHQLDALLRKSFCDKEKKKVVFYRILGGKRWDRTNLDFKHKEKWMLCDGNILDPHCILNVDSQV